MLLIGDIMSISMLLLNVFGVIWCCCWSFHEISQAKKWDELGHKKTAIFHGIAFVIHAGLWFYFVTNLLLM